MKIQALQTWAGVIGIMASVPRSAGAAVIGIDARHGNAATAFEENLATGSLFGEFRAVITDAGHTVVNLNSFSGAALTGIDALIVVQSPTVAGVYNVSDIAGIHAFVGAGHGLLLIGEGGWTTDSTVANINSLAAPFGVSYASLAVRPAGHTVTGLRSHPITLGVTTIGVDYHRSMTSIANPAVDLTISAGENDILAAVNGTGGGGNVVLLSDSTMWMSPASTSDRPLTFGDNRLLLQNTISFITVPEPSAGLLSLFGGVFAWGFSRKTKRNDA